MILNEIKEQANGQNIDEIISEYADTLKVSKQTILLWNKKFNIFQRQQKNFDEDLKKKILEEFKTIGFTRQNIIIIANKYNTTEVNIYNWNRKYQMFSTKTFKKGADEKLKNEVIEKLKTDKIFKDNLLNSIKQKSKE